MVIILIVIIVIVIYFITIFIKQNLFNTHQKLNLPIIEVAYYIWRSSHSIWIEPLRNNYVTRKIRSKFSFF